MKDPFKGFEFPSEEEITEATRVFKIKQTHNWKMKNDPQYAHNKRMAGVKTGEAKRKIPLEDYADICRDYYNINGRPAGFYEKYTNKYNVKKSVIEKIALNFDNLSLPKEEFEKIKNAFYEKFPLKDIKSNSLKKMHNNLSDEKRAQKDLNIRIAQDPIDAETAIALYEECKYHRDNVHYKAAAAKYKTKDGKNITWEKVRNIVNGHHFATKDFDIEADVKEYRLRKYGTFKFTSPDGEIYHFEDEKACGEWMIQINPELKNDPYRVCTSLFYGVEPNTPKLMRKRFWKGWTIENIKKVDN